MFEAALSILRRAHTNFSGVQVLNAYLLFLLVGTIYICCTVFTSTFVIFSTWAVVVIFGVGKDIL
jgi:uncharacterized protein (DUF983 family)